MRKNRLFASSPPTIAIALLLFIVSKFSFPDHLVPTQIFSRRRRNTVSLSCEDRFLALLLVFPPPLFLPHEGIVVLRMM